MKLYEIFDTIEKDRKVDDLKKFDKPFYYDKPNSDNSVLGSGKFSNVKNKKNDPFLVQKIPNKTEDSLDDDAYYCYIDMIVKNKMAQSNPFAPRIYKINKFHGTDGSEKYTVDMEKLEGGESISNELLAACANNLFLFDHKDYDDSEFTAEDFDIYSFAYQVAALSTGQKTSNDPKLNALIQSIQILIDNAEETRRIFLWDIHSGNIMFRRVPHGVQMVITDPIAQTTK